MDLRLIENILKIEQEKSISKAAQKLYLTQPALNQQLLSLEKELGTRLFYRNKTGCVPTPAGEIYLDGAREVIRIRNTTYSRINDYIGAQKGKISIGFTPERGIEMFTHVFPEFHRKYPNVIVEPKEMSVRKQQEEIKGDRLDIGFMTLSEKQKTKDEYITLGCEELYLIAPVTHEVVVQNGFDWNRIEEVSLDRFYDIPYVLLYRESTMRTIIDDLFEKNGKFPEILFDTSSNRSIISMVRSGQCCGIVPAYYLRDQPDGIACFALDSHPSWEIVASRKKGSYMSEPEQAFIRLAQDYWGLSGQKTITK